MKCNILHESAGRLRVHLYCGYMTLHQADVLEYYLRSISGVTEVKVYDRTQDAVVLYAGRRGDVIAALAAFSFPKAEAMELVPEHTSRALNREFEDKLVMTVMRRCISKLFLPFPITSALAVIRSVKYIREGLKALWHGKLSVAVLDATAVTVSIVRGDFSTAGSVMFMLRLGEILEEWTHKKSVADLAGAMSLNVDKVWLQVNDTEVLVPVSDVKAGDCVVVRTGSMIPLDGKVVSGEAMVNQASMTGESMPVPKRPGSYVYAGTVAEEGECVICVDKASGGGRYDRIVHMIEESEKLKSTAEDKAARLADRLVPYTLGGTALTYLLTRNITKTLAVLMVDFSCALKLAIPIAGCPPCGRAPATTSPSRADVFWRPCQRPTPSCSTRPAPSPTPPPRWPRSSPSVTTRSRICCGWPPALRSTIPTPWPMPWWRKPNCVVFPTRSTILRCSTWWPTAFPAWSRANRC